MSDIIHHEMDSLAMGIAMRSRIKSEQAYAILIKVGFYEERYGSKPMIIEKIVELANQGCSPERIFAAIKLIPGQADGAKAKELPIEALNMAYQILRGEDPKQKISPGKRAVDL
jgi:hypothetical protein